MKKLIFAAAAAVLAMGVQAATGLGYQLNTGWNKGKMAAGDLGYYSLYSISSSELAALSGKSEGSLTADAVTQWLYNEGGFYSKKDAIIAQAGEAWYIDDKLGSDMAIKKSGSNFLRAALYGDTSITDNQWTFLFYSKDGTDAFRVAQITATEGSYGDKNTIGATGAEIGLDEGGFLVRGGTGTPVSYGDWTTVPEPTSAMLMLLGVAGLALKRKRT